MAPALNELQQRLSALLMKQSMKKGDFVLASGQRSNYYFDCKATTQSPEGLLLVGQILLPLVQQRKAEAVGGLAIGSIYISNAVVLASQATRAPLYGFTVRESQKKHGMQRLAEESYHPDGPLLRKGRRVAVVEDVVTGGGSVMKAIEVVRERECEIVAVLALVDRRSGGGDLLRKERLPYLALFDATPAGDLVANDLSVLGAVSAGA